MIVIQRSLVVLSLSSQSFSVACTSQVMTTAGEPPAYPAIFEVKLQDQGTEKIIEEFVDIISDAVNGGVEQAFVEYVSRTIEPVGWKGIWKAKRGWQGLKSNCDFLVEVLHVSLFKLEADVHILKVLTDHCLNVAEVVPVAALVDLYPLSEGDPEENFLKTAVVIERVRFFYNHVWRPWDDPDDLEEFAPNIKPRVELYMDMTAGQVDYNTKIKVQRILEEGKCLRRVLEATKVKLDLISGDPDLELDSADVCKMVRSTTRLEALSREMDIIENREVRLFMHEDAFTVPALSKRTCDIPAVHVVAAGHFTLFQLKSLGIAEDIAIEFHHSLGNAVAAAQEREKILLLPGIHTCAGLPWIDKEISVEGVGDLADTILVPTDVGDIFINCCASVLKLSNVTVRVREHVECVLMVHTGLVIMENCHIDGGCADVSIAILSKAELHMTGCKVETPRGIDIDPQPGAVLKISQCDITAGNGSSTSSSHSEGTNAGTEGCSQEPPVAARNVPLDANANTVDG